MTVLQLVFQLLVCGHAHASVKGLIMDLVQSLLDDGDEAAEETKRMKRMKQRMAAGTTELNQSVSMLSLGPLSTHVTKCQLNQLAPMLQNVLLTIQHLCYEYELDQ